MSATAGGTSTPLHGRRMRIACLGGRTYFTACEALQPWADEFDRKARFCRRGGDVGVIFSADVNLAHATLALPYNFAQRPW